MKKLLLGLGKLLSGTSGIHRLVHGGSDEGGARGTEPDIRLPLRDGWLPVLFFAAMAAPAWCWLCGKPAGTADFPA